MSDNFNELMKQKYINPIWLNIDKNLIEVEEHTKPNGRSDRVSNLVCRKFDDEEETQPNYLFNLITSVYTEEEIDECTKKIQKVHKEEAEEEKKEEEQSAELKRLEKLFKTKLDIFNVKEIFESDNKDAKSKIRRSKSEVEALMYAVVLMIEETNKNN